MRRRGRPRPRRRGDVYNEELWARRFGQIQRFKERHGHCDVPSSWPRNPSLANWVATQRQRKKKGLLSRQRQLKLERVGFRWAIVPPSSRYDFEAMCKRLQRFERRFGHTRVPSTWQADPRLAAWVMIQRQRWRAGTLPRAHRERLDSIRFEWDPLRSGWDRRFDSLVAFREQHGHFRVPYHWEGDPKLGTWVLVQRRRREAGTLAASKIRRLDRIGFPWNPRAERWEERFAELQSYRDRHGHCDVPDRFPENPDLGTWVCIQRREYSEGSMPRERIRRLERLGFVWNVLERQWEENFERLRRYKKRRGHCNVPSTDPDRSLARWVVKQRVRWRAGSLPPEREKRLRKLGLELDPRKGSTRTSRVGRGQARRRPSSRSRASS